MTLWTALLIAVSVPLMAVVAVWAVPVWIAAEGEYRGARRRGALDVGLLMGLLGVRVAVDGTGVRVRLLLFRRPTWTLKRTGEPAGPDEAPVSRPSPAGEGESFPEPESHSASQTGPEEPSEMTTPPVPESGPDARTDSGEASPASRPEAVSVDTGPERRGAMARVRTAWGYVRRFQRPARRFLGRLRRSFRVRRAVCDLYFGAGDPATTGQICGFLYAVRPLLSPRTRIGVWPDFLGRRFEGEGSLTVSVSLARITWAAAALAVRVGGPLGWEYVRIRWVVRQKAEDSHAG